MEDVWKEEFHGVVTSYHNKDFSLAKAVRYKLYKDIYSVQNDVYEILSRGFDDFYMTSKMCNDQLKIIGELRDIWRDILLLNKFIN